jgi:aspartate aminotransferase
VSWYADRRNKLVEGLKDCGLEFTAPEGAFYFFPKVPKGVTDTEFCDLLATKNVLVVPGGAFGDPTCFRLCYCVEMQTIEGALPLIKQIVQEIKGKK